MSSLTETVAQLSQAIAKISENSASLQSSSSLPVASSEPPKKAFVTKIPGFRAEQFTHSEPFHAKVHTEPAALNKPPVQIDAHLVPNGDSVVGESEPQLLPAGNPQLGEPEPPTPSPSGSPSTELNADSSLPVDYSELLPPTASPEQIPASSPIVDEGELPRIESASGGSISELLVDISGPLEADSNPVANQDKQTGIDASSLLVNLDESLEREASRPLVVESEPPREQVSGEKEAIVVEPEEKPDSLEDAEPATPWGPKPAIAATTPAAAETPLMQGSSSFSEETTPAFTEPSAQALEAVAPIVLEVIGLKSLTGAELAKRLGVNQSNVSRNKDDDTHFRHWSGRQDPEGISWQYRPGAPRTPQYHPFACLLPWGRTKGYRERLAN